MKLGHGNQTVDMGSSGQITVDTSPLKTITITKTKIKHCCIVIWTLLLRGEEPPHRGSGKCPEGCVPINTGFC